MNLWKGVITTNAGRACFRHESGLVVPLCEGAEAKEDVVYLALHSHLVSLVGDDALGAVVGIVTARCFKGATVEFTVDVNGLPIQVNENAENPIAVKQPGDPVSVDIPGNQAILLQD